MAFDYYGSKKSIVTRYQPPLYDVIVEPFAGSASYAVYYMTRRRNTSAILCDKCHEVITAWEWIKEHAPQDILARELPRQGEKTSDFFVKMASVSNAAFGCSKMTVTERMAREMPRILKRMARIQHIMGRISLIEGSYESLPDIEATWFVDPPYQVRANSSRNGNGYAKGCRAEDINYERLGEWCMSRRGQVVVCEKDGADWLPFRRLCNASTSVNTVMHEVVWTNMPDAQMEFDFRI